MAVYGVYNMKILVLNGSPRPAGNTAAMIEAFKEGVSQTGHTVSVINVCSKNIAGCTGCEYCHTKGKGECIIKDDMDEVYSALQNADMLVISSPIYYFCFTAQLQCALHRTYAIGIPKNLKKSMLILSSGSDNVYDGAIFEYQKTCIDYMKLEDVGIFTAYGTQNQSKEILDQIRTCGQKL